MRVVGYITQDREPGWPGAQVIKDKGGTSYTVYSSHDIIQKQNGHSWFSSMIFAFDIFQIFLIKTLFLEKKKKKKPVSTENTFDW